MRVVLRSVLSIGHTLPTPWNYIAPALAIGTVYLLAARVLWPYIARAARAAIIVVIGAATFAFLLPDLVATSIRRADGRQPPAWTFPVGDGIVKTHDRWNAALRELEPKRKQHTKIAVTLIAALTLLPLGAYNGAKNQTHPGLRSASTKVLNYYSRLERWASK